MKAVPTVSPSPVRAFRAVIARAQAAYIALDIKAAEADVQTWNATAAAAQARANLAERELARLRRKFNAIR